jgi:hypothetical protein
MRNISTVEELKNTIQLLELEQSERGGLLKEQLFQTYDSLRFINLLKSALKQKKGSHSDIADLAGMAIGLVSGYISKKIFIGTSSNAFRKLMGSVIQLSVISFVSRHPSGIKSIGHFLLNQILNRRE